jgi:hypothetical protein
MGDRLIGVRYEREQTEHRRQQIESMSQKSMEQNAHKEYMVNVVSVKRMIFFMLIGLTSNVPARLSPLYTSPETVRHEMREQRVISRSQARQRWAYYVPLPRVVLWVPLRY